MGVINKTTSIYLLAALIIAIAVGLTFGNLQIVRDSTSGFDFQVHWQGARDFLSQGISPYRDVEIGETDLTTAEAIPVEESTNRFLAPLFALLIYIPLGLIKDVNVARALWMTILEFCLFGAGYVAFHLTGGRKPLIIVLLVVMYSLFSAPSFTALASGNMGIFSLLCMVLAIMLFGRKQDEAAGLALAFSLFKPDWAYPLVLFFLIWSVINQRTGLLYWFLGSFILLMGFSMLLIPEWPIQYFKSLLLFGANNPVLSIPTEDQSLFSELNTRFVVVKNILVIVILVIEWFFVRVTSNQRFYWLAAITLALTSWIGVRQPAEAAILCLPGFLLALSLLQARWKNNSLPVIAMLITSVLLLGWVLSDFFFAAISGEVYQVYSGFVFPLMIVIMLYWSRWWVVHTAKMTDNSLH